MRMGYPYPRRPCKSRQFTARRGRKWPRARSVQARRNPTTSSPPLCCSGSLRNAFSVTNSRCFPIVTLPSLLSRHVCIFLCVCACSGRRGCWGLKLSADWRQLVDCLELQLILTLPSSITIYPRLLVPAAPHPVAELWQPGGGPQPGPPGSVTLAPFSLLKTRTHVKSSGVGSVLPLSTAFTPFN